LAEKHPEGIDILHATTTFDFASHELLRSFLLLILPQSFAAITSIEQCWIFVKLGIYDVPAADKKLYNEMRAMLANIPNLIYLKIAVVAFECPQPVPPKSQEIWLQSLDQLRGERRKTFELQVPVSYGWHFDVCEGCHFKLSTFPDFVLAVCHLGTLG
jgi:hypothetical protein